MDLDIEKATDEELLSLYGQCNESLEELTEVWTREVTPRRGLINELHAQLIDVLLQSQLRAIEHDGMYVRLAWQKGVQEHLTPELVQAVGSELRRDRFESVLSSIEEDRAERYAKEVAKRAKKSHLQQRRKKPRAGQTDEPAPIVIEPTVRYVGKYPQRPFPALGRPLTKQEVLAEVLYTIANERHKTHRPVLSVSKSPGRLPPDVVKSAKDVDGELPAVISTLVETTESALNHARTITAKRERYSAKMKLCEPRLQAYLKTMAPEDRAVKRTLPTSKGDRTIRVYDSILDDDEEGDEEDKEDKEDNEQDEGVGSKKLSLWEFSEIINNCVKTVVNTDDVFRPEDIDSLLSDAVIQPILTVVSSQIDAMLQQRRARRTKNSKSSHRIRVRRSRLHAPLLDADEDEDDGTDGETNTTGNAASE